MLRMRGMWLEVESRNASVKALLISVRSSLARVGKSLLLDQVYSRSRRGSLISARPSMRLLNLLPRWQSKLLLFLSIGALVRL